MTNKKIDPSLLLHYDNLTEFKKQRFHNLLTVEHLIPGEVKINKLAFTDGSNKENANFWGWKFEKNGKKYLLPSRVKDTEIKINEILPILAEGLQKVAVKGEVHYLINDPKSAKFKSIKCMTFREMIDTLSGLKHSNPIHQKLYWFIGLASMMDRCNFRISTPPAFGKDSTVFSLGSLVGSASTIENPTLAKLEWMTSYKWLVVSEINDISKPEWKIIENFLLAAGAHKSEVAKHSRAVASGVKEILNLKEFSLALIYNDIDCYPKMDEYIDLMTKKAVLDRFPALRLYGTYLEDFNNTIAFDSNAYVKENFNTYMELIYTYTYYKDNLLRELKRFNADKLKDMPQRHMTNIKRLLKVIDLYSKDQEEFDFWVEIINLSIADYKAMIEWPTIDKQLKAKKQNDPKLEADLYAAKTFIQKKQVANLYLLGTKVKQDNNFFG